MLSLGERLQSLYDEAGESKKKRKPMYNWGEEEKKGKSSHPSTGGLVFLNRKSEAGGGCARTSIIAAPEEGKGESYILDSRSDLRCEARKREERRKSTHREK